MAADNQFEVFGVDVRDYGRLWLAAWRDFLMGDDSPIRRLLDAAVQLKSSDGTERVYQAGRQVEHGDASSTALALPEALVLARTLQLPSAAEADIDAALTLEVSASSPFAADDTAAGWRITRNEGGDAMSVALVVVSRTATMRFLEVEHNIFEPSEAEIWAPCGDEWVVVRGFGEAAREQEYQKRLMLAGGLVVASMVLILLLSSVSTLLMSSELAKLEEMQVETREQAANAMRLRDRLGEVNTTITELNKLSRELPSPLLEIARLTELLPDSSHVVQYTQNGQKIRLRGRSTDAASLQQALTEEPAFRSVTSPQAISRVGSTDVEQFFLDLELKASR